MRSRKQSIITKRKRSQWKPSARSKQPTILASSQQPIPIERIVAILRTLPSFAQPIEILPEMSEPTPHESAQKKASMEAAKGFVLVGRDPEGEKKVGVPRPTAADEKLSMDTAEKVTKEEAEEDWTMIERAEPSADREEQAVAEDWNLVQPTAMAKEDSKVPTAVDSEEQSQAAHGSKKKQEPGKQRASQ